MMDWCKRMKDPDNVSAVLCGNKCDLADHRQVAQQEGRDLARSWRVPFFETSGTRFASYVRLLTVSQRRIASTSTRPFTSSCASLRAMAPSTAWW